MDELFSYYNENGMFNDVVLVAENGEIVYNKAFDFSDYENKLPFDSLSVFAIASITKTYTATAAMMLKEKGLFSYDDKLSKYATDFPEAAEEISIRYLLTHTSGIPDFLSSRFKVFRLPLITDKIALDNINNQKNEKTIDFYGNSNYGLLTHILSDGKQDIPWTEWSIPWTEPSRQQTRGFCTGDYFNRDWL